MEDTITPTPVGWDGEEEDLGSTETVRKDIRRLLKGLDPHTAHGPGEVSLYVLKECARNT